MQTLQQDQTTGIRLYSELRRAPGGEMVTIYKISAPIPLPEFLMHMDAANGAAAARAFDAMVAHVKAGGSERSD